MHNLRDNFISYALRIRKKKTERTGTFVVIILEKLSTLARKKKKIYIYVSLTYVSMYIAITLNITRKR